MVRDQLTGNEPGDRGPGKQPLGDRDHESGLAHREFP
jgi:hypothetical protein